MMNYEKVVRGAFSSFYNILLHHNTVLCYYVIIYYVMLFIYLFIFLNFGIASLPLRYNMNAYMSVSSFLRFFYSMISDIRVVQPSKIDPPNFSPSIWLFT